MVWTRKTTRKTYRKKRAYKKRIYKKRAHKKYIKNVKPWRSTIEDQIQKVVHTSRRDIWSRDAAGTSFTQFIVYWSATTNSPNVIVNDSAAGQQVTLFESVLLAEVSPYRSMYKKHRLEWIKITYTPTTLQYNNTAVTASSAAVGVGVHALHCLDVPQGTPSVSTRSNLDAEIATSPLVMRLNPKRKFVKFLRLSDYLKQYNAYSFEPTNVNWTDQLGATVLQINYSNLSGNSILGRVDVDYCVSYKGRQVPIT